MGLCFRREISEQARDFFPFLCAYRAHATDNKPMITHSQSDPRHSETHSKPLPCHIVALLAPQSNIGKRHTNLLVSATQVYLNFNLAEKECNHSFSHATLSVSS
ncbi:hypothetical protein J3E68DRAFT_392987 [Trichoderma sp. SZMC 28012]